MGVDFYACDNCGETFCDAGDYFRCDCGDKFCSTECGGSETTDADDTIDDEEVISCIHCRRESATASDLLYFMLKKYNLTYEEALEMYKKE